MKIAIETRKGDLSGLLLKTLAATVEELGHAIVGPPSRRNLQRDVVAFVWNGRRHSSPGPTVYCEHGWLPRWDYQLSTKGINADSHLAPFRFRHDEFSRQIADDALAYLESLRKSDCSHEYMRTAAAPVDDLPPDFLLVPLQIEQDTNILRHVPERFRRMQSVIDHISATDPPVPIVFKQHPADLRRGSRQLQLRVRRPQDALRTHKDGNIHQILKTGACRAIVSLNSNVVHDGIIWDVPAVVLGRNVWPREGVSPFYFGLPSDWADVDRHAREPETQRSRMAYVDFLRRHQWSLKDAASRERVDSLLRICMSSPKFAKRPVRHAVPAARKRWASATHRSATGSSPMVNVVARNHGWLFEDLKTHFVNHAPSDLRVNCSESPSVQADAWIFLRTHEAQHAVDPGRTLVQIHDQWAGGLYRPGGARRCVDRCAAVTLTHPGQRRILEANGISLASKRVVDRPMGAAPGFSPRTRVGDHFTVGWVGRPTMRDGRDLKRTAWIREALAPLATEAPVYALLLGERLERVAAELEAAGVHCTYRNRREHPHSTYPAQYRKMDVVLVTSETAAGPNCVFEALASGLPVVATPVGRVPELIRSGENGLIAGSPEELSSALSGIRDRRQQWFERRETIQQAAKALSLEAWIRENLTVAVALAEQRTAWSGAV